MHFYSETNRGLPILVSTVQREKRWPSPHSCCSQRACCPPSLLMAPGGVASLGPKGTKTLPSTCFVNRWLPESARWLIITGKLDQALRELKKVAKINGHQEAKRTLTIEVRCCCL